MSIRSRSLIDMAVPFTSELAVASSGWRLPR
jgi:hypothetical protein